MIVLTILVGITIIFYLLMVIAAAMTDAPVGITLVLFLTLFILCAYFYTLVWVI